MKSKKTKAITLAICMVLLVSLSGVVSANLTKTTMGTIVPDGENPTPAGAILKQTVQPIVIGQSAGPSVAIIAGNDPDLYDVEQKLLGTGKIGSVTKYNIVSGPVPTLGDLQTHDAVLVWGGLSYWSEAAGEALGNVLADYADGGGGVVVATFSLGSNSGRWIPKGRFADLAYWCLEPVTNQISGHQTLGTIYDPGSPILADVYTFDGGSSSYRVKTDLVSGAALVADWTDGTPLIATRDLGFAQRVDLNFYPPSTDVRSDFWDASTDGDEIMANALVWVAGVAPTPVVSISTDKFKYHPGDKMLITIYVSNPTKQPVTFKWFLGVPTLGFWMSMYKGELPPGFEKTFEVPFPIEAWEKEPFSAVWYVDLQDPETGQELVADCACWSYCPLETPAISTMPSLKDIRIEGIA